MRVELESPKIEHVDCYHEIFSDEATHHFIIDEGMQDFEGSKRKLQKLIEIDRKSKHIYTVVTKNAAVGFVIVHLDGNDKPFISYAIRRSFWRQGYAAAAINSLLAMEKENFNGFSAATHLDNRASQGLLLKCDFERVGIKNLQMGERVLFEYNLR